MPLYGQLDPHRGLIVRENSKQPEKAGPDSEVAVLTWENIVHLVANASKVRESLDNLHLVASCIANKPIGHAPVGIEMPLVPVGQPVTRKEENKEEFATVTINSQTRIVVAVSRHRETVHWRTVDSPQACGDMTAIWWKDRSSKYNTIAAHATATLKASVEPTIRAYAEQAGRIARLEDDLRAIRKVAHDGVMQHEKAEMEKALWNIYEQANNILD